MSNPILAIDASNLICRAYTSNPELTLQALQDDLQDRVTQARNRVQARHVVAALDAPLNWRRQIYERYKDGRSPKPAVLKEALANAGAMMRLAGARTYHGPDLEADDVLATMAHKNPGRTIIMTTDQDLYGAVNDRVMILAMRSNLLGPLEIEVKLGVPPARVALYKALRGDKSDNIPGVPGIGEKGAAQICMTAASPDEAIDQARRHRYDKAVNTRLLAGEADLHRWYGLTCLRIGEITELKA